MKNSKVFQLISILSKEEWKKLRDWLNSPWANSNKNLVSLFAVIEKGYPHFKGNKWTKEKIFSQIYEDKPYHNKVFNNLLSEFSKQIKRFLAHSRLAKREEEEELFFVAEVMEKRPKTIFEEASAELIKKIEKRHPKSTEDYLFLHQLNHQLYYQPSAHLRMKSGYSTIDEAKRHLDNYYQLQQKRYLHDAQIRANMFKEKSTVQEEIISLETVEMRLYQMRLERKKIMTVADYLNFKTLYYEYYEELAWEFQQDFLFCCINDSVNFTFRKDIDGIREMFEHFQFGFGKKLLLYHNQISHVTFNNILLVASHLGEAKFALSFFQNYVPFLSKEYQSDASYWGRAELSYINGEFGECEDIILQNQFSTKVFTMQSKGILLRTNFELYLNDRTQYDKLISLCKAIEKYFQRNKDYSKIQKNAYIRFVQYLRRLVNLVEEPMPNWTSINTIKSGLDKEEKLFGKGWLIKKMDFLFPEN